MCICICICICIYIYNIYIYIYMYIIAFGGVLCVWTVCGIVRSKGIARRLLGIVTRILKEKKLRGRVCRERGSTCVYIYIYKQTSKQVNKYK